MAEETSGSEQPLYTIQVYDTPKFDLTSYISNYKGRTVFRRLYLIASCSTTLREEAARLALIEASRGSDVKNYNDAVALLKIVSPGKDSQTLIDPKWPMEQEKKNLAETKRMDNELRQYKNNLIRESIRMGSEDIGLHHHATGNLPEAIKGFSRMRDYCTTSTHHANSAFRIIAVAIEQRAWLAVQSQVHKIRSLQFRSAEESARNQPKTSAAMGLQQMSTGDYKEAAMSFLGTDPSLGDTYIEILTSNDVAVYGGLCALASMSRSELQTKVLDNVEFRNFLELEPHIRRAIQSFCASKYSQCLDILESYRADYLLDIYLQPQLANIYDRIRTKSIIQYFQPFSKVTLASMEQMFGQPTKVAGSSLPPSGSLQDELIILISEGRLDARIDLEQGVLVAKETDSRAQMQKDALEMADAFIREARLKLLRLNVINGGLEVKPPAKKKEAGMDISSIMDINGSDMASTMGGNFRGTGYSLRGNQA